LHKQYVGSFGSTGISNTSAECATPAPTNAPVRELVSTVTLDTLFVGFVGLATTLIKGVLLGAAFVVFVTPEKC
jgi:hypothetical protein